MPIVPPGSKILVTGANGYIATWLVRRLLEQGYFVRGTARSEQKGAFLLDLFKPYGDKFELVVVEDFSKVRCCLRQRLFLNRHPVSGCIGRSI